MYLYTFKSQCQNPTSPCSRVISFTRFPENLTSDLEVTEILTRSRFLVDTPLINLNIPRCLVLELSPSQTWVFTLPAHTPDNTQSGLYSWRVKINFRISKSVLSEHNVFLQNTIKIPDEDYLFWKAATVMEPFKSKTVVSYIVPQRIKCEI